MELARVLPDLVPVEELEVPGQYQLSKIRRRFDSGESAGEEEEMDVVINC